MGITLGVTGHRPPALGGYSDHAFELLVAVAIEHLVRIVPEQVITGMAQGWDQAVAEACVRRHIPFIAAVPFQGQESQWPAASQGKYHGLLFHAQQVVYTTEKPGYAPWKMGVRNKWIVDHSHQILACWDGVEDMRSGTFQMVRLVRQQNKPLINVYPDWQRLVHRG